MHFYVTGDCHGDFNKITFFCEHNHTTKEDYMIILGDACLNYWLNKTDRKNKEKLSALPLSFFMVYGNHEERPYNISSYKEKRWQGGTVYYEEEYPSLLFAKDGEIYDFEGKKGIVIGGAYSVDKWFRISAKQPWFPDEQPSKEIKEYVENNLKKVCWKVDYVFSHTCPKEMMPEDLFLEFISQESVDNSTEEWLSEIYHKISFNKWYFGHFHDNREYAHFIMLYEGIYELDGSCVQKLGYSKYIQGDLVLFSLEKESDEILGRIVFVNDYGTEKLPGIISYDIMGIDDIKYEEVPESQIEDIKR